MLTRTTTRRSAFVLTMALIAMFLIVLAGSARATQTRTGASTGQANPTPHQGRHTTAVAPVPHDQSMWHLDLVSTPPVDTESITVVTGEHFLADASPILTTDAITAVGRAPPAL